MMNKRAIALVLALCMTLCLLSGCGGTTSASSGSAPGSASQSGAVSSEPASSGGEEPSGEAVDYAASVKLDMNSSTAKQEVTVKLFVDGDTTHFYVPSSVSSTGVLKARYLAVNTPESTGKIEEYGKKASAFTKEKLSAATSIIIESENENWNADSTGDRYLSWIWYKTDDMEDYRNLNIELLQNGLAIASNTAASRYGEAGTAAIEQAKAQGLNIYSGQPDPDYYYGEAVELTLKELRINIEQYEGMKVAFNGVVTNNSDNSVYVESFDPETGLYYGISVYYGYNLNGAGLEILTVGNEVRIVGSVQYYEAGGTYQVSDLNYRMMKPDDPGNIQKISEGNAPAYALTDPVTFYSQIDLPMEDSTVTVDYAAMIMSTSVEMKNLKVEDIWTTTNEESASKGAMTLTCKVDGTTISVRTAVLYDEDGNLITAEAYKGKTIDVRGIVDYYSGKYQIKVFSADQITVH